MAALFVVTAPGAARGADPAETPLPVLHAASELDYPPFALVRDDGAADGFSVALLKAVAQAAGFEARFKVDRWDVIKQELIEGRLDALPLVSYSEERDKVLDFSASYLRMHGTIFVRKGNHAIQSEDDLKDKELLVMRGDTAHEYALRQHLSDKLILTDNYTDALRRLSAGKHDAVLIQYLVGLELIKQLNLSNLESVHSFEKASLKPAALPLSGFEQKFCIAVQEGDKELLARLNEGLAIVIADGQYDRLYDKWFGPIIPPPAISPARIIRYLLVALLPILGFLGGFGIWYLRREVDRKTRKLSQQILVCQATEASLIETRDTLQAILDAAPAGIVVTDGSGHVQYASQFAERFFSGVVGGDAYGVADRQRITMPDGTPAPPDGLPLSLALEGRSVFDTELMVTRPDGTPSIILASAIPLPGPGPQNQIVGAVAVFQDITGRKKAEEALVASERQYRELIETANSIILRWDRDGAIRFINDYGLRFFGYTAGELVGRDVMTIVPRVEKVSGRDMAALVRDIVHHPERHTYVPNENITKDGRTVWVAWTNKAVLDDRGEVREILAIGNDITALKEAERVLQNSNTRLELLSTVSQRLLRAENPQAIVEELCRLVMAHIDCQCFFNYMVAEPGRQMALNAYAGIPAEAADAIRRIDFGTAVCGCTARDGVRIIAEEIGGSDDPRVQLVKSFGVQAYCCHPLQIGDQLIGTLSFGTRTRGRFAADEIELMQTVADKVALAMQRLRDNEVLRASERRLSLAISATADAIWEWNFVTGETYYSPRWYAMLGYAEDEIPMTFDDWKRLCHPEDLQTTLDLIESRLAASEDEGYAAEFRMQTKQGEWLWILGRGRVVERDAAGQPVLLSGTNTDISDRKQTEAALRESEQRFRLALRNAPVSVAAQDRTLRYIWAYNQHTAGSEELIGRTDDDIFTPVEARHITAIKRRVIDENTELREQLWLERPPGRIFLDVYWEPIHDEAGRVAGVASAAVDLTPVKLAEEALKSSLAEKEVLLKEIHHRVKNNMQVISSLVDLQADDVADEEAHRILQDVAYRVRSMAMVHEKLYQSTDLARVEFADYAQSLLDYLARAHGAAAAGVRVEADLASVHLPVNVAVPCGLILNELFSNALKHAFAGRRGGVVAVSLGRDARGRVRLVVCDDGPGLAPEIDWRRARTLGLRLVQMLARQLHAAVEVKGDRGTTFTLTFEGPEA